MKNLLFVVALCLFVACSHKEKSNTDRMALTPTEKHQLETFKNEKQIRLQFTNYIRDLQEENWKMLIPKYLKDGGKDFLEEHEAFRNALTGFSMDIKHLVVEGNEAIAWLNISAKHTGKHSAFYDGKASYLLEPTGKNMAWTEVWYFNFIDGKFGGKFDFLADELTRIKQLGIKNIPE